MANNTDNLNQYLDQMQAGRPTGKGSDLSSYLDQLDQQVAETVPIKPSERSWGEAVKDAGVGILKGTLGVARLGALAGDKLYANEGFNNPVVKFLDEYGESVDGQKSEVLQARERAQQKQISDSGKSARAEYGDGWMGKTAEVASEFGTAVKSSLSDPVLLSSALAEQIPMMGAMKAGAIGVGALAQLGAKAAPKIAASALGKKILQSASVTGAVGAGMALQGVDIASNVYQGAMDLPDADWDKNADFSALASEVGREAAKVEISNQLARMAGLEAAAISGATSLLPGGKALEKAIAGKGRIPLKAIPGAIYGEARQEGLEEGGGKIAENYNLATLDPTRELMSGAGGAAGQGAAIGGLLGGGMTAARSLTDTYLGVPDAVPVDPVVKQLDDQIAKGDSPLSRAAVASTPDLKVDPFTQRANEVRAAMQDGGLQVLREIGPQHVQDFLTAMQVAGDTRAPATARQAAVDTLNMGMQWMADGKTSDQPATGSPFSTELTVPPGVAPFDAPTQDALEQDLRTVDGQTTEINENQIGGPLALDGPPSDATPEQPAPAGFFTPEDQTFEPNQPLAGEQPASTATENVATPEGITDVEKAPVAQQTTSQGPKTPAAAPVARKQVFAPKAMALPETPDNPGTAQVRKRKAQLAAMAATGFSTVERRPEGFFLVNPDKNEEMRLDSPGDAQMARTVVARSTPVAGAPIDNKWTAFHPESGTLNIPRAEMPQIKSEHRGSMVNFLAARGITSEQSTIPATDLKPTQAEFSQGKVDQAKAFKGNDRAILVSSDGHVLDGHHQWLAKIQMQQPVKVLRLNAPIAQLLTAMKDFPSAGMTKEAAPATLAPTTGVNNEIRSDGRGNAGAGSDATGTTDRVGGAGNQQGPAVSPGVPGDELRNTPTASVGPRGRALRNPQADAAAALALSSKEGRSIELADPANPLTKAVDSLLDIMAGLTGHRGIAVHDTDRRAFDGAAYQGNTFINVANPEMHVAQTIAHEFKHLTEKFPALKALYDRMWDLIPQSTRRQYFETYLQSEKRDRSGNITRARGNYDQITPEQNQKLKDEMLADFMGQRFNDKAWLNQLAKQKPALFGNFVREWLAVLDNIIDALKGLMNSDTSRGIRAKDLDTQLKRYVRELNQMKAMATEVAIAWAEKNPGLAAKTGAADAVAKSQQNDAQYSARDDAEQEYRDVVAELKDSKTWLRAPNGEPTKLTERQWVQARTPSFLKWFGDWRTGNIWGRDDVSKAVGKDGEPVVVYHGTDKGGFMSFNKPTGDRRGDLGIFTTDNYDMARSYVRKGRPQDLTPASSKSDLEEMGYEFQSATNELIEDGDTEEFWYTNTEGYDSDIFESEALAVQDALENMEYFGEKAGIYEAFVNIRNPNEEDFEGALWSGERDHQYVVLVDGETMVREDGKQYFDEDEAKEFAKEFPNPLYEDDDGSDYVTQAVEHWNTTDDVVREARTYGSDGAIIRQVVDDGGGPGYDLTPSDVFVAFKPNQLKSADFNTGEFGKSDDIRYSVRDPAIGDRTDVAKLPKGKPIPTSVGVGSLENALVMARSKSYTKGRQLKVDLQDRVLAAAKAARVDLTEKTQENFKFLTGMVLRDAQLALQSNANAVGWYDKTVSRAIGALSTIHPEIETDPTSRLAFLWALATTSNGLKVDKNFSLAEAAYVQWRDTGIMPSDAGIGNAAGAINSGLDLFNSLAEKMGHDRLFKFMATEFEVGQIDRMLGVSPGGEWKPTPVLGSAVLGPKIGNGFFSNLNGYFHALTIDRWLMRTWGRLTGTLLEVLPANVAKSRAKLGTAIASMNDSERKMMAKLIGQPLRRTMTRAELDAVADVIAKTSMKPDKRELMNATAATTRFRLDGNGHSKILDGQKEAPSGPAERNWMRAVFTQALADLNQDGKTMTMSDLQALLWYPERRLYDAAKSDDEVSDGYEDDEAPDYANAARDLALEAGVPLEAIQAAMDKAEAKGTVRGQRLTDAEKAAMLQEFRSAPEQQVQLAFEVAPNPDNKELTAQWNELSLKERDRITKVVKDEVFDDLVELTGVDLGKPVTSIGGFDGEINPNLIAQYKRTKVSIEDARLISAAIGLALDQKSVALVDPRASGSAGLIRLSFNGKVDKHAATIFSALQADIPEVDAFTARGGNFDVLNFTGMTNEALHDKMRVVLDGLDIPLEYVISHGDIQSELVEKESYEGYITGSRPGSGSEILLGVERIRDRARFVFVDEVGRAGAPGLDRGARTGAGRAATARRDDVQLSTRTNGDGGGQPSGGGASDRQGVSQQPATAGRGAGQNQGISGKPGRLDPLPGAPKVPGYHGPDPRLVEVAEQYALANGIDLKRQSEFVQVDPQRAARIAQAYADMQHAPKNPRVKEAFANLIKQTKAQYDALVDAGYKFWFIDFSTPGNEAYADSPWNAMRDVRENQTMGVFPTQDGFGSGDVISNNPLETTVMDFTWPSGSLDGPQKPVLANDLFRAVHDAFGHGLEGAGFRAQGEENAWQAHRRLFTGSAVGAITSETRGQNSWLNYGPNGESNRAAKVGDTVFADQKTGLMPEWTWTEGVAGDISYSTRKDQDEQSTNPARELADVRRGGGGDQAGGRVPPRYGSPIPGAVSATGYHFSRQARTNLSSDYYGTGLKGAEAERLGGQANADIRPRVFFYVNKGNGVRAESGVGGYGHHVQLDNLYDVFKDSAGLVKKNPGPNNWERAVLEAGFDGYLANDPIMPQGYAVLLGKKHSAVPVEQTQAPGAQPNPVMERPVDPGATKTEGGELVKKPNATEMIQLVNPARRAQVQAAAPSFKLQYGSFRVKAAESRAADLAIAEFSPTFRFGEVQLSERETLSNPDRRSVLLELLACL